MSSSVTGQATRIGLQYLRTLTLVMILGDFRDFILLRVKFLEKGLEACAMCIDLRHAEHASYSTNLVYDTQDDVNIRSQNHRSFMII